MNDDLENQLDDLYRGFDAPARRLESRWRPRPRRAPPPTEPRTGAWIAAGSLAAAALLLATLARSPGDRGSAAPSPDRTGTPVAGRPEAQSPVATPSGPERTDTPVPEPRVEAPRPSPGPMPAPRPTDPPRQEEPVPAPREDARPVPAPTRAERRVAVLAEIEGSFELAGKASTGRRREVVVGAGDRLISSSIVRVTLAPDRFVLLAPRSTVEFGPAEDHLRLVLDRGEILAELVGPGIEVRVAAGGCEVSPVGTVFSVRVQDRKTRVVVEEGRVEFRTASGSAAILPGQGCTAGEDGRLAPPAPADLRTLAWARAHRAAERTLFEDEFLTPRAGDAEFRDGAAHAVPNPGWSASKVRIESPGAPFFLVPAEGRLTLACRTDRAARLVVQLWAADVRLNFMQELRLARSPGAQTVTVDFAGFIATDPARRPLRLHAGAPVEQIYLMYGEEGEDGRFRVNSIRVVQRRPR